MRPARPPEYAARWLAPIDFGTDFELDTRGHVDGAVARLLTDGATVQAGELPVDFGHVDFWFEGQSAATHMAETGTGTHLDTYLDKGVDCLYPVTFFGPRVVRMMGGVEPLRATQMPLKVLPNGGARLQLTDEPWNAEPETLKFAQRSAERVLRATGIFAEPHGQWSLKRGPRWVPPEDPTAR
jgi:hypothetical protein